MELEIELDDFNKSVNMELKEDEQEVWLISDYFQYNNNTIVKHGSNISDSGFCCFKKENLGYNLGLYSTNMDQRWLHKCKMKTDHPTKKITDWQFIAYNLVIDQEYYIPNIPEWKDYQFCFNCLKTNPNSFKYFKNPNLYLQREAVKLRRTNLIFINDSTYEVCELAVKFDGLALNFISQQTDSLCKKAVENNPWSIEYVKNKTEKLCNILGQ